MKIPFPRKITVIMHKIWNSMPKFIRKNSYLNKLIIQIFVGSWLDLDWKKKYKKISKIEWEKYYDLAHKNAFRDEDITSTQKKAVLKNIIGNNVLEVGCGSGQLSILMSKKVEVTALDCSGYILEKAKKNATYNKIQITFKKGFVESLPFSDSHFDTTVCCHTLEHVQNLEKSIKELKRVTSKRLIIIVPQQNFNEFTPDLHTHFFENKNKLSEIVGITKNKTDYIDTDIFYLGNIN
jgi:ubiquinone/menaquinone biosynthesis C-methylase UbiE